MSTVEELKIDARNLPEDQRFALVADLMGTLPVVLSDADDGSAEAKRRFSEMKSDPSARRSWGQIRSEVGR